MMQMTMIDDRFPRMPWDEIDNVVFDVGNVLLSFQPAEILRELVPEVPQLHPLLTAKIFHSPYWVMMDHGLMNLAEATEAMIGPDKALDEPIRRVMGGWVEMKHVLPEGLEALEMCRAHGKRTYVLSNYGDDAFRIVDEKYDFFRLFDGKIISSRVKLIKPDRAIYDLLTDTFRLERSRTLFLDDAPANIETALHVGWQGFCVNRPGKLHAFLTGENA